MTPEGHALSAWITFSAFKEGGVTVAQAQAQAQALERTSDPFIELTYILGADKMNDRFWEQTLENLASSLGVAAPSVTSVKVSVDRRREWRYVRNLRHSPAGLDATVRAHSSAVLIPAATLRVTHALVVQFAPDGPL